MLMKGVEFVVDEKGKKKAVVLDLKTHREAADGFTLLNPGGTGSAAQNSTVWFWNCFGDARKKIIYELCGSWLHVLGGHPAFLNIRL